MICRALGILSRRVLQNERLPSSLAETLSCSLYDHDDTGQRSVKRAFINTLVLPASICQ